MRKMKSSTAPACVLAIWTAAVVVQAQSPSLTVSTVVKPGPALVDGTGTAARFRDASQLAIDSGGNLYVFDRGIRKVTPAGEATTLVSSVSGFPSAFARDNAGNFYYVPFTGGTVEKVGPSGSPTTTVYPAAGGQTILGNTGAMAFDGAGILYAGDTKGIIRIAADGSAVRIAGGGPEFSTIAVDGAPGVATFSGVDAMVFDASGNLFVASPTNTIRKVTPDGTVTTIAGADRVYGSADGVGTAARFNLPSGLALDAAGNLYIADSGNRVIRRMAADGTVTTIAGTSASGNADGPAASATFLNPRDVIFDAAGNLLIADTFTIRKLSPGGVVTTVAGLGSAGVSGVAANLTAVKGVAVKPGAITIASDAASHTIVSLAPSAISVSVIGGVTGSAGSADGPARMSARITSPRDIVFDPAGNAFVADRNAIRRITPGGIVTTFAGKAQSEPASVDGTGTQARFRGISGIVSDAAGNLFAADACSIRKITPAAVVSTIAGSNDCRTIDGTGAAASFDQPQDLAIDGAGNLYLTEFSFVVRKVTPAGAVTTLAGLAGARGPVDGAGAAARFVSPGGIVVDGGGNVFVADAQAIRRITPAGDVATIAGVQGSGGTVDGAGAAARFVSLGKMVLGPGGTIYASDAVSLRAVTLSGAVSTLPLPETFAATGMGIDQAGTVYSVEVNRIRTLDTSNNVSSYLTAATAEEPVDGYLTVTARFNAPGGVAVAPDGSLIVADTGNHTIRRIASDVATTLAGTAAASGLADGTGAAARFNSPQGVAVGRDGVVYVADTGNSAIRRVTVAGAVSTYAGPFVNPRGVAVDADGVIYVADTGNHVIRVLSTSGAVTTLAGSPGLSGSADGSGSAARFSSPAGVTVTADGTVYVADAGNHTIRAVSPAGVVTTVAGTAGQSGLRDGIGAAAQFNGPEAIIADPSGSVYIADTANGSVRLGLNGAATAPIITANPVSRAAAVHDIVQFSCAATGTPSAAFEWQQFAPNGFFRIFDGGGVSGVDTPILTVADVGARDNAKQYRCRAYNAAGSVTSAAATLTVNGFTLSPGYANFAGVSPAGSAEGPATILTAPQTIAVGWNGAGSPAWTVSADQPWVQIASPSGAGAGSFTVSAVPANFPFNAAGETGRVATVTLTPVDPDLRITMRVLLKGYSTMQVPFGLFETPANNVTGLQGSLAVTGWALDNIAVDRVEIWRDRVAGETTPVFNGAGPGNGKIFIATATFVPGARPDVEAIYASAGFPRPTAAGWGYMLLTQGLWNQGNGTFTFYAFAFDTDGAASTIGTKTITIDNANATKPFGTIDTPSYGGTVSGMIQNFGWALTPGATCSIANPNVQVSIDSGALTPVVYGDVRTDIAGAFPSYTNAAAAGGHYTLDTATLTNGMHTIGWFVTDSCGRSDGMGSRFFTVANTSSITAPAPAAIAARAPREWSVVRGSVRSDPPPAAADGTRVLRIDQGERVELQLPGDAPYSVSQAALPIGSSFDASDSRFYWQPAAGFLGAYDLSFTAGARTEHVRAVVGPPIRMVIDTPHAGNVLASSGFTVAGWAVDLASLDGAGIDTLHVWAYPVGGGAPTFVGVAQPRGARPDIARLYGASFGDAGFTLDGTLSAGTYDLVVFAHSAASNTFAGAETVRVVVR
jgi:sugar lactone lactonase YvrE